MTDWFRSWHGAPTDPKWLGIAKRAGVAPGIVVAVAWALMDRASQSAERGSIVGYDAEGLAYFYGCEPENVEAIVAAMVDKGMIVEDRFASWEKRQPVREDDSAKRVREHRESKKREAERNVTQRNAAERNVTQRNAPDTDTDTDTEDTSSLRSDVCPEPEKSAPATTSPPVIDLPATQGQVVTITEADVAEWQDAFPAVDVPQQLRAMRQWLLANERNRKTVRGMRKFVVSWLSRDQDQGGRRQTTFRQSQAPPSKSAFHQHQDEIYQRLKRETGDRHDEFTGTTLDIGPGDYRPH